MRKTSPSLARFVTLALAMASSAAMAQEPPSESSVTRRALDFLAVEVPAWSRENGCFSCHNNGDAARALFEATRRGHSISRDALESTLGWIQDPAGWDANKGDPGVSDKHLADLHFSSSLATAIQAGLITNASALETAALRLIQGQSAEGAWRIEAPSAPGSPVTYGNALATYMALRVLRDVPPSPPAVQLAVDRASRWFTQMEPKDLPSMAACLLAATTAAEKSSMAAQVDALLKRIERSQTSDGGWGPYPDSVPEAFDTAVVLWSLSEVPDRDRVKPMIQRGRRFLVRLQNPDGSWPETTRPSGSQSYAQRISTTGWAILALMETSDR